MSPSGHFRPIPRGRVMSVTPLGSGHPDCWRLGVRSRCGIFLCGYFSKLVCNFVAGIVKAPARPVSTLTPVFWRLRCPLPTNKDGRELASLPCPVGVHLDGSTCSCVAPGQPHHQPRGIRGAGLCCRGSGSGTNRAGCRSGVCIMWVEERPLRQRSAADRLAAALWFVGV
jgi:hypothetical protein